MADRRRTSPRRRGSAYLLVLSLAAILAVIGLGAVATAHLRVRMASSARDQADAEVLAMSAVEQGLAVVGSAAAEGEAADTDWRATFFHGSPSIPVAVDRGTMHWVFFDATGDGNIGDDPDDPITLMGVGRVGDANRFFSIVLVPDGEGLEVLGTAMHTAGNLTNNFAITAAGGPVSVAGTLDNNDTITGDAEAGAMASEGTITGSLTSPAPAKAMPSASLFEAYRDRATQIHWSDFDGGGGKFEPLLLSAADNPYGQVNEDGVYWIHVPWWGQLKVESGRISGTLVLSGEPGAKIKFKNTVLMEPHRPDYPVLIIKGANDVQLALGWTSGTISEAALGLNLNPADTPFEGESDFDLADTYPAEIRGLVHIIGADTEVTVGDGLMQRELVLIGAMVIEAPLLTKSPGTATFTVDTGLAANPPDGYTTGDGIALLPGSWRWMVGP